MNIFDAGGQDTEGRGVLSASYGTQTNVLGSWNYSTQRTILSQSSR